jgi:hypothetical protein
MALNYTEISATTQKYYVPKLIDNVFLSNILLLRSKKKGWYETVGGGEKVVMPVAYAQTSAFEWFNGAENLTVTANDQISAAEYDWKQCHATISITGRDEKINGGSKERVIDFVRSKVQLAEKTLSSKLGTGLYNDGTTDTKAIVGLRLGIDSAGTYGGINRSTYSWWSAQEDSTTTALSLGLMQSMYGDCTVGNSKPSIITTTQDVYDIYIGKLQPMQRYTDSDTASAGFTNVMYASTPVVVDGHCPANHMFFINEEYIKFIVHKDADMKFEPFIKPTNQDVAVAHIFWMGALGINNCRMHGKLGAIAG